MDGRPTRLAGIAFEPARARATLADTLPRMDIAGFAGFAARGPLLTPTAVEDARQFEAIFGNDLALAWDEQRGEMAYAALESSVRAFFRNGGRRCWVVRIPRPTGDIGLHGGLLAIAGLATAAHPYLPVVVNSSDQLASIIGPEPPPWVDAHPQSVEDADQLGALLAAASLAPTGDCQVARAIPLAPVMRRYFAAAGKPCVVIPLLAPDDTAPRLAELFLDPDLADCDIATLLGRADYIRYQAPQTRELYGVHALMRIDEVTLIAVPDAAQRGWTWRDPDRAPLPNAPPPSATATACGPIAVAPGEFAACVQIATPELRLIVAPEPGQPLMISWTAGVAGSIYELQEASRPDFSDAAVVYRDTAPAATFARWYDGTYYYRVRATSAGLISGWSAAVGVRLASRPPALLDPPYVPGSAFAGDLLRLQAALLRMCAARGDLVAVLSLPEGYRESDAFNHVTALKQLLPEAHTRSFGAIYHPWLMGRDQGGAGVRLSPPEGAVIGMIARRTLARGAWLAPANQPLEGVVALWPPSAASASGTAGDRQLLLQEAGVNLIRRAPRGFMPLSAVTLAAIYDLRIPGGGADLWADDPDLRPLGVRRLLILLRRLALREGATYSFEANSPMIRRQVQRGFEALLEDLYRCGAFAGTSAASAFQVDVGTALNPQQAIDRGQLIVELRVAPARPLRFLTIRLVRSDDQVLLAQER